VNDCFAQQIQLNQHKQI